MMKQKNARRTLALSLLSLLLCCSMLVGTTFAWFTDSVQSGNNKIVAGNLDIELEYSKDMGSWASVEGKTDLFSQNLWEPGHTEVVYLRLSNLGSLSLKYEFAMNFTDTVIGKNKEGKDIKLSEHLKYGIVDVTAKFADRAAARQAVETSAAPLTTYTAVGEMAPGDMGDTMALVVFMPETVGNEANHLTGTAAPTIDLGLLLQATQVEAESDSFGNDYDAGASFTPSGPADDTVEIKTYADLVAALNDAADGATIRLANDIQATGDVAAAFNKKAAITLDLNGFTISGPFSQPLLAFSDGEVTLTNGTLRNVHEAATETQYSLSLSGNAVADVKGVTIETSGIGINMTENAKITELNANVDSFMNANGTCCYDAVSLLDNARIDKISGGEYKSYYTDAYIQSWYNDPGHAYSGIASYPVNLNGDGTSIGEIAGGTFLGVMDKGNNGTPIHVNNGKVELISGGYFGFVKTGLTEPQKLLFTNAGTSASIGQITGGTFEKGSWGGYGCDFAGIVDASSCKAEETGETVTVNIQFSTRVTTYTLKVVEVTAK